MHREIHKNLVTVVIPTYNSAKYLDRSIQSALSQSYPHLEIIVIDDGSIDNTKSVVGNYAKKIKYIYKENGGPASARNLGIKHSVGEFIAFLDADDYWLPDKMNLQIKFLKENPQYAMVHANAFINDPKRGLFPAFVNALPRSGKIFKALFEDNLVNNLTAVVKRSCIDEIKGFDESKELIGIEDYDMWLRIALNNEIGYLHKVVAVYNIHDKNISDEKKAVQSQLHLIRKFLRHYPLIEVEYPGIFREKLERVSFRYACLLMHKKMYEQARSLFSISMNRHYLYKSSMVGVFTSLLKTNILFKDRVTSLRCKHYGNFLMKLGKKNDAMQHYLKAFRLYPLQKTLYRSIAKIF